jgi:isoamylase
MPDCQRGQPAPLGATLVDGGINFSVFSRFATAVELHLFDHEDDARAARVIQIDPHTHRTYHYWHIFVPNVSAGQLYGLRVHGPNQPDQGLRFDSSKLLLDPYCRAVAVPKGYWRAAACAPGDNAATAMKSVVVDVDNYDWGNDCPLHHPSTRTIIYEMHVRGFTQHPSSGVSEAKRGTYAGLIEKIPYLQQLGITAVELLPVFQFDPQDCPGFSAGLVNYWGYQPISFFAPHHAYSSGRTHDCAVNEFRDMVKALHRAGIEVILDVVFNHTAEGSHEGPTLCYRGIDNGAYYILEPDRTYYSDFSGTGNTLNADNTIVRRMILDSLRYWVQYMHVDGFRFDLASVLSRDSCGKPLPNPPILWDIESDPVLAETKLIAEAWDAAGLYQVGSFIGDSWKEWNGHFRDDVRSFFRGERGAVRHFADRLIGSPNIYGHKKREAEQSVNFVTCHDGFTLNDLVSYDQKHNEANRENNRDGHNDNKSWNCGAEGPTDNAAIEQLRNQQAKNFLTTTLMSLGIPMLLMGDEVRRTQSGNNNAYCLDNPSNWFDWTLLDKHKDLYRFVSLLLKRRSARDPDPKRQRIPLVQLISEATKQWQGVRLAEPDWGDNSHCLALTVEPPSENLVFHFIFNAYWHPLNFALPLRSWRRWIDTSLESPNDIVEWDACTTLPETAYLAAARSVAVLISE